MPRTSRRLRANTKISEKSAKMISDALKYPDEWGLLNDDTYLNSDSIQDADSEFHPRSVKLTDLDQSVLAEGTLTLVVTYKFPYEVQFDQESHPALVRAVKADLKK